MTTNTPETQTTPETELAELATKIKQLRRKYRKAAKKVDAIILPYSSEEERQKFFKLLGEKLDISNQLKALKTQQRRLRHELLMNEVNANINAKIAEHERLTKEARKLGLIE